MLPQLVQSPARHLPDNMFPLLLSLLHLHFVFSGALPVGTWDNPPLNWLDDGGLCKQNASLAAECRLCICEEGQLPFCVPINCPQTLESEENKCKPGAQWKVECNKCYCDESGTPHCTVKECQNTEHLTTNKEIRQKLKGKLDENGKCITNGSWAIDCNKCSCSKSGELFCTGYHCRHKRASGKVNPGGKCKPGERWKLDECNDCVCTHTGYASCSLNDCPKQTRPKRSPAETGKIGAGGRCKPGERWKLDECNDCVCTHTGYASCSLNDCPKQKRPKRSPAEKGKIGAGGRCKPGERWKLDECNDCVCTHTGYASCSLNDCPKQKRPKRSPAQTGKIGAGGRCKPGERWKLDECNDCVCTHTGYASCSLNDCPKQTRPKRSPAETGKIGAGGRCKPGERWKLDECNDCVCTHTGYASCSLNDCPKQKRPKRSPAETGKIGAGGKCKPGERWKLDECNDCVCTHTGYASCSLNDCPKQKRPKRSPAETELRRLVRGACEHGLHFAVDECNTCTCVDGSALDCTQKICAPLADREKRSSDGSRLSSDFLDSNGICKETGNFKNDCNTCICSKGYHAACTLKGCLNTTGRVERTTRDTAKESGLSAFVDSNGICKETVSFKYDCNTCICQKGLAAGCTLMGCQNYTGRVERITQDKSKQDSLSDFLDSNGICKETVSFKHDCNTCICSKGQGAACTLMGCQKYTDRVERTTRDTAKESGLSAFVDSNGICKETVSFKYDCNTCICQKGLAAGCTLMGCQNYTGRVERITQDKSKQDSLSDFLDSNGICKETVSFKHDCNTCICSKGQGAACTLMGCQKYTDRVERITHDTAKESGLSAFVDSNGVCKETVSFKYDCNTCFCQKGLAAGCTLMGCQNYTGRVERITRVTSKQDNLSSDDGTTDPESGLAKIKECSAKALVSSINTHHQTSSFTDFVNEEGRCKKPGNFMSACNTCRCIDEGSYYFCTLLACPEPKNKLLRLPRGARNENGNSGLECKPGASWKENCNSCFCSERGIAMCTDIPTCPSPPPAPVKDSSGSTTVVSASPDLAHNSSATASEATPLATIPSPLLSSSTTESLPSTSVPPTTTTVKSSSSTISLVPGPNTTTSPELTTQFHIHLIHLQVLDWQALEEAPEGCETGRAKGKC